jgi:predicted nucleic acid-binding protein
MSAYADTSAFYALLVKNEAAHAPVRAAFAALLESERPIWTTSFVVVETMALLQHRIGLAAARDFDEDILPLVRLRWVNEDLYRRGADRLWRENRRGLSLVDCVGFEFMKFEGLTTAFAVDPHFKQAGFALLPGA